MAPTFTSSFHPNISIICFTSFIIHNFQPSEARRTHETLKIWLEQFGRNGQTASNVAPMMKNQQPISPTSQHATPK
jgi:phosphohistidine phosphatase SixA